MGNLINSLKKDLRITQKIEKLGVGSFSEVWKVKASNRKTLAAKFFTKIRDEAATQRAMEAERNLFELKHDNIVHFVALIEHEGVPVLLTEFISGETLTQLMSHTDLRECDVKNYTRQMFSAVAYIHSKNIIHRDLKGCNMMVTENTCLIKLIDFGLSHKIQTLNEGGHKMELCGSLHFHAPELVQPVSDPQFGTASDVWALGCVVYTMATGSLPYWRLKHRDVLKNIRNIGAAPLPRRISQPLIDFYRLCVANDPGNRPSASELLQHQFLQ